MAKHNGYEVTAYVMAGMVVEPVAYLYSASFERGHVEGELTDAPGCDMPVYSAPPAPMMPAELHSDTQKLVAEFCTALAEKLYKAQLKYGYSANWKYDNWQADCLAHFQQHISKGDPRDVAVYCAFMWYHGWNTEAAAPAPVTYNQGQRDTIALVQAGFRTAPRMTVTDKCPKCDGTGMADSGGVQPWGEPISIKCDCNKEVEANDGKDKSRL